MKYPIRDDDDFVYYSIMSKCTFWQRLESIRLGGDVFIYRNVRR